MSNSQPHRFPKDNRLPDAASFDRVFANANRSGDRLFTVLCRKNTSETARLGLAISKKNCRKASNRNRIRRVVRESFRRHKAALGGLDVVVMSKPPAAVATNPELFASLETHWTRLEGGNKAERERHG